MNFQLIFALYDTGKSTKHEVATINCVSDMFYMCFSFTQIQKNATIKSNQRL